MCESQGRLRLLHAARQQHQRGGGNLLFGLTSRSRAATLPGGHFDENFV
jgi:hypothetical protein